MQGSQKYQKYQFKRCRKHGMVPKIQNTNSSWVLVQRGSPQPHFLEKWYFWFFLYFSMLFALFELVFLVLLVPFHVFCIICVIIVGFTERNRFSLLLGRCLDLGDRLDLMTRWPWLQKSIKSVPQISIWWLSSVGSRSQLSKSCELIEPLSRLWTGVEFRKQEWTTESKTMKMVRTSLKNQIKWNQKRTRGHPRPLSGGSGRHFVPKTAPRSKKVQHHMPFQSLVVKLR